ncbi:winged helix-turn-helix domain-containing protein [Bacillus thuringiensis]|uniref:helix-turn-helix domain-containing protein n=1 Tax=Bacillus thuringiensis TaxID=1428 RepID=UPI000B41FA04|nr:winged helix-turn-helix domain-containing protein [Bacillus thuringiensis]ARX70233.1 transposase [Bacillus thuringiensis]
MAKLYVATKYGVTPQDLLREERKIKDSFFKQRLIAVRLVMEGHSATSASQILAICRQSLSTYIHIFNSDGIDGLLERRYPLGRAQYLSSVEEEEVHHMLTSSTPAEEGIGPEAHWDTRVIQTMLKERYHLSMSRSVICDMLHRWGFTYTRPTYRLQKTDPLKQKKFLQELDWIKKLIR